MTGARISFGVFDETAAQTAVFSSSRGQPWVDYSSLTDGIYPDEDPSNPTLRQYVTGEPNMVRLDGTYRLFPDDPGASLGFWSSNLSGADGAFATTPVLSCVFGGTSHSSVGVTIHFGTGSVLKDFTVEWQNSAGGVMSTKQVQGNTNSTVYLANNVDGYYGLRITCRTTDAPYRYVQIQEVEFGEKIIYDQAALVSASVVEEVDISGASVPAGSLQFTALDPAGRLNPVNPEGIYNYLRKGIPINVEFLVGSTYYPGGIYYLDTWDGSNTATAKLTAVDEIGLKSAMQYASAFLRDVSADDIFDGIFTVCQTQGHVSTGVGSGVYIGYIPLCGYQEALSHACLACGGFVRQDRTGGITILPIPNTQSPEEISGGDVLGDPVAVQTKPINQVSVEEYSYKVSDSDDFSKYIDIQLGPDKRYYRYTFDGVYDRLQSWIVSGQGQGSWHEEGHGSGYNYIDFDAWADGPQPPLYVEVTGRKVTVNSYTKQMSDDGGGNIIEASGIPLITKDNAEQVVSRLREYGGLELKIKAKIKWTPGMQCGDCVSIPTRFGLVVGHITRMDIDLTGGLLATVEVLA